MGIRLTQRLIASAVLALSSACFAGTASASTATPASASPAAERQHVEPTWFQKVAYDPITFFTLVLAISTIALSVETFRLRRTAQQQAKDTADAIDIARASAAAANSNVQEMRRSTELEMRAYVLPEALEYRGLVQDERLVAVMTVKNFGRTPAVNLIVTSNICVANGMQVGYPTPRRMPGLIAPGNHMVFESRLDGPFSPNEFTAIVAGTVAIWWGGTISYEDVLGETRTTTFRYYWRGNGALPQGILPLSNAEDGNGFT